MKIYTRDAITNEPIEIHRENNVRFDRHGLRPTHDDFCDERKPLRPAPRPVVRPTHDVDEKEDKEDKEELTLSKKAVKFLEDLANSGVSVEEIVSTIKAMTPDFSKNEEEPAEETESESEEAESEEAESEDETADEDKDDETEVKETEEEVKSIGDSLDTRSSMKSVGSTIKAQDSVNDDDLDPVSYAWAHRKMNNNR